MSEISQNIGLVTFVVRDYNESIAYFTGKLGFILREDKPLEDGKRWVVVCPSGGKGTCLLLAKAATTEQEESIGIQSGGRVFLFLYTDNFPLSYEKMKSGGVEFIEEPREERYGTVVVFKDLYGNKWDLMDPRRHGGCKGFECYQQQ